VLMLLNVVVWDRSDMMVLKSMNHDIRQVAFFSVAFNLADRLLKLPDAFGQSIGATMMAQYGRGREKLQQFTAIGAKYTMLVALPLLAGTACVSRPVVALLYGDAYRPLVPVLMVTCIFGIAKSLINVPTSLLQTTENQGFLIWTGCIFGAVDIGLDFLLTATHGALGAAFANGIAQAGAAVAIWIRVHRLYRMDAAFRGFLRIALAGAVMVGVVVACGYYVHGYAGIAVSVALGAAVWLVGLRATGALDGEDRERLMSIGKRLPGQLRPLVVLPVEFITPKPAVSSGIGASGH
jgi:O-antigen/teichoic acid export membrane protein